MKIRSTGFVLVLTLTSFLVNIYVCNAQVISPVGIKWWNPEHSVFPVFEGQAWPREVKSFYDRLPERAEKSVRGIVWQLSRDAAGLKIKFKTDASNIHIRYVVMNKSYSMPHFSATGVSGVDLYALNNDDSWDWADGAYSFGDTITYLFDNLNSGWVDSAEERSFHLYLPLYNQVEWLEIGVNKECYFEALPALNKKPIVIYGTSIAQGGCVSRAGMAWTSILEREMNMPLVNLGFSGNAKMEPEIIELLQEIDAEVFILDCLPNLDASTDELSLEVEKKYIEGVLTLRKKHPNTPILLTEHTGDIPHKLNSAKRKSVMKLNCSLQNAYKELKDKNIDGVYILSSNEIGLDIDSTVDGLHPTDLGMLKYARAYQQKLLAIFKHVGTTANRIK